MTILEQINRFSEQYGKTILVNGITWRFYRCGSGAPILWLAGGLRRAALTFNFLERLSERHVVIAPDYPSVCTIGEFISAFDAILDHECVNNFVLGGQSYGGMLAQAYLAQRGDRVEQLILSSTGPADYSRAWLPVEYVTIALARLLPEKMLLNLLADGLLKIVTVSAAERTEWEQAVRSLVHNELWRADVISHFAIAADLIRRQLVVPAAYRDWTGRAIVLRAENDPTQSQKDIPHYEKLLGRKMKVVNMGNLGHTALLYNPEQYVQWLETALNS